MKQLGDTQKTVLALMKQHGGYWYLGCGWLWDTPSGTDKILKSLVKRGLATFSTNAQGVQRYDLTKEGQEA